MALCCRGSVIAKIVGNNVKGKADDFDEKVQMYVHEELINGEKLSDLINLKHENVKYLPGVKLPTNVVCTSPIQLSSNVCCVCVIFLRINQCLQLTVVVLARNASSPSISQLYPEAIVINSWFLW